MKIALVQTDIAWENKAANFKRVGDLLASRSFPGGGLIVLPELFATGFTMNSEPFAENDLEESESFMLKLAKEKGAHVAGGWIRRAGSGFKPANCASIASPQGKILCRYHKTHPFSLGGEHENYTRGKKIETVNVGGVQMTPTICYDLRFPETYRLGAQSGTQVFLVMANWPEKRIGHWTALLRARAIENLAYVIGVNRCGQDPGLSYNGHSVLFDFMGEIVAEAGAGEGVTEATINLQSLVEWRNYFPALRDMHDEFSS